MTAERLAGILEKHKKWLRNEEGGECANLSGANLSSADLRGADLSHANLSSANLSSANLSGANLSGANLNRADLSGTKGLLSSINFIGANFERVVAGYIAYKTFNFTYDAPETWKIEPGAVISENVNANRTDLCGCGINVAPLEWVRREYPNMPIWKVLIRWEWLAGVCVPYNTDGKIRCERVELLEVME